jgi:hypothetical protein
MLFKTRVKALLDAEEYDGLLELSAAHGGKVSNSLISLASDLDEERRWRAILALGLVTARMYDRDPEQARRVVRQLIWNLNEESGGIGWGMPEAFGEILARQGELAEEYAPLLAGDLLEEATCLEPEPLQIGVVWALGRVKKFSQEIRSRIISKLLGLLDNDNKGLRGLAVWSLGELHAREALQSLGDLPSDERMVSFMAEDRLIRLSINEVKVQAQKKLIFN